MTAKLWPNLFVVGAIKAGTSSLHRYLDHHPLIYMSPVKEPFFFSRTPPGRPTFDESSYLDLFAGASGEMIRGESSPLYLWEESSPGWIKQVCPNAKIVILLRDPVQRAYAHYLMDVEAGVQKRSFAEAIQRELERPNHLYVELGRYADQVLRYLELFQDGVLVLVSEEFFRDTHEQLNVAFRFLGLEEPANSIDTRAHNAHEGPLNALGRAAHAAYRNVGVRAVARRLVPRSARTSVRSSFPRKGKPELDPEATRLLREVYADQTDRLERVLGRDLPWTLSRSGGS